MIVSILADTLSHYTSPKITVTHHYYTKHQSFEQSLDIYHPPPNNNNTTRKATSNKTPIVALVVGSAWVGHRSFVYAQTSWWNSSGSKTIARLGYTCVCIRHRGSFPRVYSWLTLLYVVVVVGFLKCFLDGMLLWFANEGGVMDYLANNYAWASAFNDETTAGFIAISIGLALMNVGGRNSASFRDMEQDVMDALAWFDEHRNSLIKEESSSAKIVFGGYSSGGHVAAIVMQQPELWKERNLPPPQDYCSTALYISAVLCTKPYQADFERHISSLSLQKMAMSLSDDSTSCDPSLSAPDLLEATSHSLEQTQAISPSSPPCWFTNHLISTVFGRPIPSPIQTYSSSPTIPHIFIGCNQEMFGLNWLDLFFASKDYSILLKSRGVDSKFIGVDSDHWNILGSSTLAEVLERELKLIQV